MRNQSHSRLRPSGQVATGPGRTDLQPRLPCIALSGYGLEEDPVRSRAAGFLIHLVQPITVGLLEDAIATLPAATRPVPSP